MQIKFASILFDCIGNINAPYTIYIIRTWRALHWRFTQKVPVN